MEELAEQMKKNPLLDGLTLSGGEPFLQAYECAKLAAAAHEAGLDVWTYTGYLYENLIAAKNSDWDALLQASDVLVDGPFLEVKKSYSARFRGSANQRLIDLKATRSANKIVLWKETDPLSHFTVPKS
ncbi:hypothetical protein SDC9_162786 [bioreactor metagenome]|uniref:7-carboxy-7-deazaguanine synthase n=1 Tax=bioreactor metagenome TaxID=1076179 RepID=A0A645FPD9_9ZZZZ